MKVAVTIAWDKDTGTPSVILGPEHPIADHRALIKEARGSRSHPSYAKVVTITQLGTAYRHSFRDGGVILPETAEAAPETPPASPEPPEPLAQEPDPQPELIPDPQPAKAKPAAREKPGA